MNFFLKSRCIIKNIEEKNRIEKMNCFAGAAAGRHGEPARQGDVVPAI